MNAASLSTELTGATDKFVAFLTSGTSGTPKLVRISLDRILRRVEAPRPQTNLIWGHFYDNSRIASHNVVAHALSTGSLLAERPSTATHSELIEFYLKAQVQAVAGTPSLLRVLLGFESFRRLPLEQISLGGEIVDEAILSLLKQSFPSAKVTHIYATTETGSLFSVSDGRAGFPSDLLLRGLPGHRSLEIRDGRLVVNDAKLETTFDTGDLVELDVKKERVYFKGRSGDFINVGGRKVSVEKVRNQFLASYQVTGCRVYPVPNKFLGEVVGVEISPYLDPVEQSTLLDQIGSNLEKWERPVVVSWSHEVSLSANGKTVNRMELRDE